MPIQNHPAIEPLTQRCATRCWVRLPAPRNDSHTWQKTCTSLGHIGGCSVTSRITMAARVFSTRTASAAQAALTSRLRRSFSHFAFFTDLTSSKRLPAQTDPAGFPAR